jgi:hypothetical protein
MAQISDVTQRARGTPVPVGRAPVCQHDTPGTGTQLTQEAAELRYGLALKAHLLDAAPQALQVRGHD